MIHKKKLLVLGAGGHGRSVAEAAQLSGLFEVVGFLDDAQPIGAHVFGYPILGSMSTMASRFNACDGAIVAIGNNSLRETLMQQVAAVGMNVETVIHPHAFVSPSALVGKGAAVMAGAIVGTEALLGVGAIVNCGAVVDHHARVDDFGHLGVNACMAGGAVLGRGAWMQAGSALGYGVTLTPGSILLPGMGKSKE